MNIVLDSNLLVVKGIDREGKFFVVEDNIGFSTGDGTQGFNNFGTSFKDDLGELYPKVSDVALVLVAMYNASTGEYPVIPTGSATFPELVQACSDYSEAKRTYVFTIENDGWYTIHALLLPLDSTKKFYYNAVTNLIMGEGIPMTVVQALNISEIQHIQTDMVFTPNIELEMADRIGKMSDLGLIKGRNSEEFHDMFKAVSFVETMLIGAKVKFGDNSKSTAQMLIENLSNANPYEFS